MKNIIIALIVVTGASAGAATANEFIADFARSDEIIRAGDAFGYCTDLFAQWPNQSYANEVTALGSRYTSDPDAVYYLLNSCQTMWSITYLDPLKTQLNQSATGHARLAYYLANLDLLHLPKYLGAEIRIFTMLGRSENTKGPPAPYELLTHIASSDHEVDEIIQKEMRDAFSALAGAGGMIAGMRIAKSVAAGWSARTGALAQSSKTAIIAALVAGAAYEAVDVGLWHLRQNQLWDPVAQLTKKLSQNITNVPQPVLLEEFYKTTVLLGYFYSYGLYLDESGLGNQRSAVANKACEAQIKSYFANPDAPASRHMAGDFLNKKTCGDAVSIWLSAGEFLKAKFPGKPAAELISARLISRAKRTFMSYEEIQAYEATQPICDFEFGTGTFHCLDRQTGNPIL